jgi:uncharacterized protein YdeI (YjbR/CyaY-like superfamily)
LIILKGIREQIGKTFGDEIKVSVEVDVEERVADVPAELKRAFKSDKEAKSAFEKLSYTHQKEYVKWVNEAKKDETRQSRIAKTLEMKKGKKQSSGAALISGENSGKLDGTTQNWLYTRTIIHL